jgi:3,4-dihydroxy 2-butanone 4-phosphate synthase/GTP cyclohydrolase II
MAGKNAWKECKIYVKREAVANLPTEYGDFKIIAYSNNLDNREHVALLKGDVRGRENLLVRVHSKCLTGDSMRSLKCDCGSQLQNAMEKISKEDAGVIVYLDQEGRGIGLINKIRAYELQDRGYDTVEANEKLGLKPDLREYHIAAKIIHDLGINSIRLITNNPEKIKGLKECGVRIVSRVPSVVKANSHNIKYLKTKAAKMGHLLHWSHD